MANAEDLQETTLQHGSTRIGQRIGPFELTEAIAHGGGTTLFRAVRPVGSREPRTVAIRMADNPREDRAAAWVLHEYGVLRSLDDPRIPRAYGYYASQAAVATTFIDGVSVADAIEAWRGGKVAVDPATAMDIVIEVAHAMRHAHSIIEPRGGIVHSQLCPDRVRLGRDGAIFLVGFGRAPQGDRDGYIPPEQSAGAFTDARSDQWSLGALAVELLLGRRLYDDAPPASRPELVGDVEPWIAMVERRWPSIARVLRKMLSPAAGDRFDRDSDLVRELLAAGRAVEGRADRHALAARVLALSSPQQPAEPAHLASPQNAPRTRPIRSAPIRNDQPRFTPDDIPPLEEEPTLPPTVSHSPPADVPAPPPTGQPAPTPMPPLDFLPTDPGDVPLDPMNTLPPLKALEEAETMLAGHTGPTVTAVEVEESADTAPTGGGIPIAADPGEVLDTQGITIGGDAPKGDAPGDDEPPLPHPEIPLQRSELAGIIAGAVLVFVGIAFLIWRFG